MSPAAAAVADPHRWDLSDLYTGDDDPALERDLATAAAQAETLATHRGHVAMLSPANLAAVLDEYEALLATLYRPGLYAQLRFAADTDDPRAQALLARTREAGAAVSARITFLDVELRATDAVVFDGWLAAPALAPVRHYLAAVRKGAPHTLSEAEEKVLTIKGLVGAAAWSQLYDETLARIRVPLDVPDDGGEATRRELTVDEARALRSSPDRALRAGAVRAIHEAHAAESHVLTFVFNTILQDHKLELDLRRYASPIAPTLLGDELSAEVVESLMATTEANYGLAQRYYRLKARALGLSDFASHDLLAPVVERSASERKVPFDRGRELVLESFRSFSPRFAEIAEQHFARRWIDVLPRPGKRGGAFCAGAMPTLHPFVLTNYNERLEDVSTLAHELGHAIHFVLAGSQRLLQFHPTTPMAETASVFGEIVLGRELLAKESDPSVRRSLLALRIEDVIATVFRQVMYTRWEQAAHARRAEGVVTAEEFGALWESQQRALYGDAVALSPLDRWGFIGIPHFIHSRFYCYSYAFGQLLVLALYRRYTEDGDRFVPRYLALLAGGGADSPEALLERVGLDVRAPGFWQQGFDILAGLIDEFERSL